MGDRTGIAWTDSTFNPWIGCQKVSPACDRCYAETLATGRLGRAWGPGSPRIRTAPRNWSAPPRWNRAALAAGRRHRVFCASLADVFDNAASDGAREDLWALIRATPALDWQLLTKRPGNIAKMLPPDWGNGYPNVWLGTTVENQAEAERRVPALLAAPAAARFLSCEPLLGHLDLAVVHRGNGPHLLPLRGGLWWPGSAGVRTGATSYGHARIDWVIAGGESGAGARPMHPDWARGLRDQCAAAGVSFFFKQWGEWRPEPGGDRCVALDGCNMPNLEPGGRNGDGTVRIGRLGVRAAGDFLDGRQHHAFPTDVL